MRIPSGIVWLSLLVVSSVSVAHAAPIIYSIQTPDGILNNPNGTWGGDLMIGADQAVDLTVAYTFEDQPSSVFGTQAFFDLISLQVFDNTNGLRSDPIFGTGALRITYDGVMDRFTAASFGTPGGSFVAFSVRGEYGDPGDPLPRGPAFDALIESERVTNVIARAPDFVNDNVWGVNGTTLEAGTFDFFSIPEPGTWTVMSLGLAAFGVMRRRRRP